MSFTPPRLQEFDYTASRTYFVTFCVLNREPVFRGEAAADIALSAILNLRAREWYWIRAYCIMPDHIHLMFKKNKSASLQIVVSTLKRSILLRCRAAGIPMRWQSGFYDRIVREHEKSDEFVKYILLNPVRAGLVGEFHEYKYCGRLDPWF